MHDHTTLYLGSNPENFAAKNEVVHLPLIKIVPRSPILFSIKTAFYDPYKESGHEKVLQSERYQSLKEILLDC